MEVQIFLCLILITAFCAAVILAHSNRKKYYALKVKYENYIATKQDWETTYNRERALRIEIEKKYNQLLADTSEGSPISFTIPFEKQISDTKLKLSSELLSLKREVLEHFYKKFEDFKNVGVNMSIEKDVKGRYFLSGELIFDSTAEIEESDLVLSDIDSVTEVVYQAMDVTEY